MPANPAELARNPVVLTQGVVHINHGNQLRKPHWLKPGNANLPIGGVRHANREIGVPGLILRIRGIGDAQL